MCVRVCTHTHTHVFTFSRKYQCSHLHDDKCGPDGHILWHAQAAISPQVEFLTTFHNQPLNVKTFVSCKLLPAIHLLFSQGVWEKKFCLSARHCNWNMTTFHASLGFLHTFGLFILWCFDSRLLHWINIALLQTEVCSLHISLEPVPFHKQPVKAGLGVGWGGGGECSVMRPIQMLPVLQDKRRSKRFQRVNTACWKAQKPHTNKRGCDLCVLHGCRHE